ncbi:B12-binding domain-containing protein [Chloroflexota bacterium]
MQGDNSISPISPTAAIVIKQIDQLIEERSQSVAAQITALNPGIYPTQSDIESLYDDIEQHLTALQTALANNDPQSFSLHMKSGCTDLESCAHLLLLVEIIGQEIRQHFGEQTWLLTKPVLDPALEWLATQTTSLPIEQQLTDTNIVRLYTQSILNGNRLQAEKLVFDTLDQGRNIRDIYLKIIQPSLYEVGRLWEIGQVSVAQEHLATAITQSILSAIYARVKLPSSLEQHASVACLEGNYHEIGPRMLADFLQMAGYNTRFLGTNTSVETLIEMIQTLKPVVIGLPATTSNHVETVKLAIDRVRTDFTSYRPTIMVGGLAFNDVDGLWKTVRADLWQENGGLAVDQLVGTSDWA